MRTQSWNLIAVTSAMILTLPLAAQKGASQPAQADLSAGEIFSKYLEATGGMEARKSLESLILSGQFGGSSTHPLGSYSYSYKAPASDVLELEALSHGITWTGHNNGQPFMRHTIGAVGFINGVDVRLIQQDFFACVEWDLNRYTSMNVIGKAKVEKRRAYMVRFTTQFGDPVVRYYDTETFLLLRMDVVVRQREVIETYFSDYRDYGGLKFPQAVSVKQLLAPLTFKIDKLKLNAAIADSAFQ